MDAFSRRSCIYQVFAASVASLSAAVRWGKKEATCLPWVYIASSMTEALEAAPFDVLLVEDNDADATLLIDMFRDAGFRGALRWVQDGVAALDYLRQSGPYAGVRRPSVVLLDLGLPQLDGHEVLRQLRRDPEPCTIPVIVLSTSNNPQDVQLALEAGAVAFVTKAPDFDGLEAIVQRLIQDEFPRVGVPS